MSLELIREAVKVSQIIGEETAQTIIDNDIIVPDSKPDVTHILLLDGDVYVNNSQIMQDKILTDGTIKYKILYVSDDPEQSIKSINTSSNFSYAMDLPDAVQGMKGRVKCDIEHMEYDILNGRKVNIKTIVKINGKVINELTENIVSDFSGVEDIQVLRGTLDVNSYIGSNEADTAVRESLEVPAGKPSIKEILRNDIKIGGKDFKITDDKVIAKGELNITTLYIADDEERSIQFMEHEVPFTHFVDLSGVTEDAICSIDYNISDSNFEAEENSDGEYRAVKSEVALNIFVEGYNKRTIETVEDAYSPGMRLGLEKETFRVEEFVGESKSQAVVKDTIAIQDDYPDITEIFNVVCNPSLSEYKVVDEKVSIEGVISSKVLYLANSAEQPVFCSEQDIPFRHVMDIKGIKQGMTGEIELSIEHCNYSLVSAKEVEVRIAVGLSSRVFSSNEVPLIGKITESPLDEKRSRSQPSISIYFAQPGDTLWKVAKKYLIGMDDIKRINSLDDSASITPGQQIIIPKRAV